MGLLLRLLGILAILSAGVRAGAEEGVTARLIPDRVQPGDVFELRVEMDRAEYARFELQVPPQERLHRVAVETKPVALEDGRYRQRESWMLQADRSGDIVIKGATVVLVVGGEEQVVVALPPMRLQVSSYAEADTSAEPVALPSPGQASGADSKLPWWGIVAVLLLGGGVGWWVRRIRQTVSTPEPEGLTVLETALAELKAGRLPTAALDCLLAAHATEWPRELREAAEELAYAGRGDPGRLADLLEREVGR